MLHFTDLGKLKIPFLILALDDFREIPKVSKINPVIILQFNRSNMIID